jgi:hypothetical protein
MQSVGSKLLGIYFLVYGLSLIPTVFATYSARYGIEGMASPFGQSLALASVMQALLYVAAGVVLALWRRAPLPVEASIEPLRLLWVGLKLLGAFFIVAGASDVVWGALRGSVDPTLLGYSKAIAGAVELVAGWLLWIGAKRWSGSPTRNESAS